MSGARLFEDDVLYKGGYETAITLPTFLGNHDLGRFSGMVKAANPDISNEELLARTRLAHAMLMTLRGSPVIYSGDEQGFVSDGNDQLARETLFPSLVDVYNDNDLLGTDATTAQANFDQQHPLYAELRKLAAIRKANPALSRGRQVTRGYGTEPGLFAASRLDPDSGKEILLLFNTSGQEISGNVLVDVASSQFRTLTGPLQRQRDRARQPCLPTGPVRLCDLRGKNEPDRPHQTQGRYGIERPSRWPAVVEGCGDLPDLSAQLCRFQ